MQNRLRALPEPAIIIIIIIVIIVIIIIIVIIMIIIIIIIIQHQDLEHTNYCTNEPRPRTV